jgi:hypothetical protein
MNYFDFLYCRLYNYYNDKKSTDKTMRLSAIACLSALYGINTLTFYIILCLSIHKTIFNGQIFGIVLAILILTFNTFKFNKKYTSEILENWQNLPDIKRKSINKNLFVYIAISIISFLSSITIIAYIKTKYGNF